MFNTITSLLGTFIEINRDCYQIPIRCKKMHLLVWNKLDINLSDITWKEMSTLFVDHATCGFGAQLIVPIQLHVKRQNSSICKFFQDIAWTFFCLWVARSVIHISKKWKDNLPWSSRFLSILRFLRDSKKIQAEIRPVSYVTWGVCRGVCDKIVHTKMHFFASAWWT